MQKNEAEVVLVGLYRIVQLIAFMLVLGWIIGRTVGEMPRDIKDVQIERLNDQVSDLCIQLKDCQS